MRFLRSAAFVHPVYCAAVLIFFGIPALFAEGSKHAAPRAKSKVITASDGDDRKEVALSSSDTLEIRLAAVPGTGYGWKLAAPPPEILRLEQERLDVGGSSRPGAPATAILRFVAVNPGAGTIRLAYLRSWEKDVPPKKTYTLRVRVR